MKKLISVVLLVSMMSTLAGCKKNNEEANKEQGRQPGYFALVTDIDGIQDGGLNQQAWSGLQMAQDKLGDKIEYLEAASEDKYVETIEYFSGNAVDMLFCVDFEMADALKQVAAINPDKYYAMLNYTYPEVPSNVLCVEFQDQEAAFLEGYVAACETQTNKVGFIGGVKSEIISAYEYGFRAGVSTAAKELSKTVDVEVTYLHSSHDEVYAKEVADGMYAEGVDIIFEAAGGSSENGILHSAVENNKFIIMSNICDEHEGESAILSWTTRNMEDAIYNIVKSAGEMEDIGSITGKAELLGMNDNAVDIAEVTKDRVSSETMERIERVKDKIKTLTIEPPYDESTYVNYMTDLI